jgi:hypothetical protein
MVRELLINVASAVVEEGWSPWRYVPGCGSGAGEVTAGAAAGTGSTDAGRLTTPQLL